MRHVFAVVLAVCCALPAGAGGIPVVREELTERWETLQDIIDEFGDPTLCDEVAAKAKCEEERGPINVDTKALIKRVERMDTPISDIEDDMDMLVERVADFSIKYFAHNAK